MNPITSINNKALSASSGKGNAELDMQTFIQLLTVQLANQNPLEPMNDRDFFAQMAQLGTVQGMGKLQSSMQVQQASSLLGKTVTAVRPMTEGTTGTNDLITGVAVGLNVKSGENWLVLQEANGGQVEVRLSAIQQVSLN